MINTYPIHKRERMEKGYGKVIRKIAAAKGISERDFVIACMVEGLHFDTANDLWQGKAKNPRQVTKKVVARVLSVSENEIFGE